MASTNVSNYVRFICYLCGLLGIEFGESDEETMRKITERICEMIRFEKDFEETFK